MKKGFTLVELIISVGLIALIAVMSIVFIVNRKDKTEDKTIALIKNSASVKYLSSAENVEEIKDNLGYKVYNINDLINDGLLEEKVTDSVNKLKEKEIDSIKKGYYDKILLKYDYSRSGEGNIEYIYPYVPNTNGYLELNYDNEITYFITTSSTNFPCKTGVNFIGYIDEDYNATKINTELVSSYIWNNSLNNLSCRIITDENPIFDPEATNIENYQALFDEQINNYKNNKNVSIESGEDTILLQYIYKTSEGNYLIAKDSRTVKPLVLDNLKLVAYSENEKIEDYSRWYKGNVKVQLEDDKNKLVNISAFVDTSNIIWKRENGISETEAALDSVIFRDSGKIKPYLKISYSGYSKEYNFLDYINIDNNSPKIEGLKLENIMNGEELKGFKIKFTAKDEHSGLKKLIFKDTTSDKVFEQDFSTLSNDFEFNKTIKDSVGGSFNSRDWEITIIDNVGNETKTQLSDVPKVSVTPVEGSVFDFNVNIGSAKQATIEFGLPFVEKSNIGSSIPYNITNFSNRNKKELVGSGESLVSGSYSYNFVNIAEWVRSWVSSECCSRGNYTLRPTILDNFQLDVIVNTTSISGAVYTNKFRVTLNAYHDSGGFGGSLFNYSGWDATFRAMNKNGDILYSEYSRKSSDTLWIKKGDKVGGKITQLLKVGYGDTSGTIVTSFDNYYINYGFWQRVNASKNYTYYNHYQYKYDINQGKDIADAFNPRQRYTFSDNISKYPNGYTSELSSKSYYSNLSEYLTYYEAIEKIRVTNPDRISMCTSSSCFGYHLFEFEDGWYGFVSFDRFRNPGLGIRVDYTMYYFKEEVSVSTID